MLTHHDSFTVGAICAADGRHNRLHLLHFLVPYFPQCNNSLSVCSRYLHENKHSARNSHVVENSCGPLASKNIGFELPEAHI
jgi:hypothetical protein